MGGCQGGMREAAAIPDVLGVRNPLLLRMLGAIECRGRSSGALASRLESLDGLALFRVAAADIADVLIVDIAIQSELGS